jgi:heat shock protein HtpX
VRGVFAVICFVLFYVVAIAAVVSLAAVGLWLLIHVIGGGRVSIAVALAGAGAVTAAGIIAWSVLPRPDRFTPPGPEISEAAQPRLFAEIRQVAEATGQQMPAHVYVVLDANAFVAERGGMMGLGSRRVMGIGLALLSRFNVDQLRAVIAHEFGHFDGGDTRLGPWIYKTRAAMGRTVTNLYQTARSVGQVSDLMAVVLATVAAPFKWMALGYVRLAQSVSRRQEFSADALAARTVGAAHLIAGFEQLAGISAAAGAYIKGELLPMTQQRVAPPFFAGLRAFAAANQSRLAEIDREHLRTGEADPYDSHPPTSQRIEALRRLPAGTPRLAPVGGDEPASALLQHPEALARQVLEFVAEGKLRPIEWEETGALVIKNQREALHPYAAWLRTRGVVDLSWNYDARRELLRCNLQIAPVLDHLPDELVERLCAAVHIQALNVALVDAGFAIETGPGQPLWLVRDGHRVDVSEPVNARAAGKLDAAGWAAWWAQLELPERPWQGLGARRA